MEFLFRMSWEIQFRKKESELDLKLTSLQNLSGESDSTHLENEIDHLLDQLNEVVNTADNSLATSSSSKKNLRMSFLTSFMGFRF